MRFKLDGILTSQWFIGFLYRFIRAYAWNVSPAYRKRAGVDASHRQGRQGAVVRLAPAVFFSDSSLPELS